jgi:hypothetical protein
MIQKVKCSGKNGPLYQLTFIFSDKSISPPQGTYKDEMVTESHQLPSDIAIGKVEFGCTNNPYLVSLALSDHSGLPIQTFSGSFKVKQ